MGELFNALQRGLGELVAWLYAIQPLMGDLLPSFGVAIILLTIVINLLLFPLTLKQTRATRAFTEIQPDIKRIQKEYKEDPQEMQRRLMELQRQAGATPGGCLLPLLIQMPIWFALFRVLQAPLTYIPEGSDLAVSITRGAEHFLGMTMGTTPSQAVSQLGILVAIPYLLMLGVMVASQYVQQWHATYGQERPNQPGAGAQQMITRILPLFIGFISFNFPAGLVLYWTTSNLFRLGQQAVIFKIDGRPTPVRNDEQARRSQEEPSQSPPGPKPQQGSSSKRRRRKRR